MTPARLDPERDGAAVDGGNEVVVDEAVDPELDLGGVVIHGALF